jgi:hypothetical protein
MFAPVQDRFSAALLDPGQPVPGALVSHSAGIPERRFAVYRNNVTVSLVNALAARFPAVQRIVGEEFFRDMARVYVRAHPPRSRLLMEYGDDFADFIAGFGPVAELEYLADVRGLRLRARVPITPRTPALPTPSHWNRLRNRRWRICGSNRIRLRRSCGRTIRSSRSGR